ncbi:hypothetical protein GobsT_22180 [Gemmata obscuriglobus]|nr:hypothetical protein GobsT_22180 [Gemmata obscuriglobus]VTS04443.1 Uncharacterized protein OS=Planctomyces maris DSM 8797 GN=PM8797T_06285 PE=4 SV=1 [Gemmata obscuriglobus UQM 2246]
MPPWCDVTLYQMAARNVLRGGTHYRDIFDTNLPGFVWLMAGAKLLFGWSTGALRAVDLMVIAGATAALCRFVRRCGGTRYTVAWLVAAVALFYPFTSEFNHIQRDPWMLLPATLAAWLRFRRVQNGTNAALLEGFLWGAALWLKPHIVIPALAVWAVSAVLLARQEPRRNVLRDLAALVCGGAVAGAPGVVWLVATGAWPHFLDIFLNWNPAYLADNAPLAARIGGLFEMHRPWGLLHFAALPLALLALWEARVWSRTPGPPAGVFRPKLWYTPAESEGAAAARAILAALYLGWAAQAVGLQKSLDYVYVPVTLLAFAVVAAQRWCFGFLYLVWFVAVGALLNLADTYPNDIAPWVYKLDPADAKGKFEKHALADGEIMKLWGRALTEGDTPELRDRIGQYTGVHCGTNWEDLTSVASHLRAIEPPLRAGELNCWHDSTHPLYLMLDLDPATRYMHYGTAFDIKELGPLSPGQKTKREQIADAVRASRQRYVVSDLLRTNQDPRAPYRSESWRNGDPLPVWLPDHERQKFPWNQPVVFRSGRYVVHRIDPSVPLGEIRVPDWNSLDELLMPRPPKLGGISIFR